MTPTDLWLRLNWVEYFRILGQWCPSKYGHMIAQDHPLMLLKNLATDEDHGILVLLKQCCLQNGIFFFFSTIQFHGLIFSLCTLYLKGNGNQYVIRYLVFYHLYRILYACLYSGHCHVSFWRLLERSSAFYMYIMNHGGNLLLFYLLSFYPGLTWVQYLYQPASCFM